MVDIQHRMERHMNVYLYHMKKKVLSTMSI